MPKNTLLTGHIQGKIRALIWRFNAQIRALSELVGIIPMRGNETYGIKSPLLYRLSYRPHERFHAQWESLYDGESGCYAEKVCIEYAFFLVCSAAFFALMQAEGSGAELSSTHHFPVEKQRL